MTWKYSMNCLRREWPFLTVFLIILSLIGFFVTGFTYDETRLVSYYGSLDKMPNHDYLIYSMFGLSGITLQSYILPFVILLIVFVVFSFLYAMISSKMNRRDIFLLKIKGEISIIKKNDLIHMVFLIQSLFLSFCVYGLILAVFNAIADMEIPLFVFSPWAVLTSMILTIFSFAIYVLACKLTYSEKNMLLFLREEY